MKTKLKYVTGWSLDNPANRTLGRPDQRGPLHIEVEHDDEISATDILLLVNQTAIMIGTNPKRATLNASELGVGKIINLSGK